MPPLSVDANPVMTSTAPVLLSAFLDVINTLPLVVELQPTPL
jgi:hypothetical protein